MLKLTYDKQNNIKNSIFETNTPQNIYQTSNATYIGTITNCYWGTDTPTATDYGTINYYTVTNTATTNYNSCTSETRTITV